MRPGDTFDRYRLDREVGRGGMGVVFLATDDRLGRQVALKLMAPTLAGSPEFLARFHREAETLTRLDSPHIITVFDHGEVDGVPYIATQYVAGGDLSTVLKNGPLRPAVAVQIAAQMADALADAHAAGIVHRDLKPSNVLLRDADAEEPFAYLCDFGIAQGDETGLTVPGGVAGSWPYLAPERVDGAPASPATDIYGLGCLLWACLSGQAPYGGTDAEVALAHQNAPVRQLAGEEDLAGLNAVLARAMAKDPHQRFADAGELKRALTKLRPEVDALSTLAPAISADETSVAARRRTPSSSPTPDAPSSPPTAGAPSSSPTPGAVAAATTSRKSTSRAPLLAGLAVLALLALAAGGYGLSRVLGDDEGSGADGDPGDSATIDDPVAGDWDADGLGDVRIQMHVLDDGIEPMPLQLLKSTGQAFEEPVADAGSLRNAFAGDVDGDGRTDLLTVTDEETQVVVTTWPGTADGLGKKRTQSIRWNAGAALAPNVTVGDFTGDGRDDLMLTTNRGQSYMSINVAPSNGEGFDKPTEWAFRFGRDNTLDSLSAGDFDGDGKTDLMTREDRGGANRVGERIRVFGSTGDSFTREPLQTIDDATYSSYVSSYAAADVDGDGTDELVHQVLVKNDDETYGQKLTVMRFEGGRFTDPVDASEPYGSHTGFAFHEIGASDVDGDGDDDIVRIGDWDTKAGTAPLDVFLSDADGFADGEGWGEVGCPADCDGGTTALFVGASQ